MEFTGGVCVLSGDPDGEEGEQNTGLVLLQLLLDTEFIIKEKRIPRPHSPLIDSKVLLL